MKRPRQRILWYGLFLLVLVGAAAVAWHLRERSVAFYSDADSIRRPAQNEQPRDVLWSDPVAVVGAVNSVGDEYEPRVSNDGLELLFVRGRAGFDADLYVCRRTPEGWSEPAPLDAINTRADELGPEPSPDGKRLYFYSNRAGGSGGYDLWVARRGVDGWDAPVNLGPGVNSADHEYGPAISPDGRALLFASNRPRVTEPAAPVDGVRMTVDRPYDIYRVRLLGDLDRETEEIEETPVASLVSELASSSNDGAPAFTPAGDFVYFSSDRPGGAGGFDLYRARRLGATFLAPERLEEPVNTTANELDPAVSERGFVLHFSSDRPRTGGARDLDLFRAVSREVFTETETYRATIDWLTLLPFALWLVIGIFAMLLLWLFSRALSSERFRKLSLLARCLVASLIVHALLLTGMAFWGVGTSLSNWMQQGRGMRVALVSTAGRDLTAQLRGSVVEVEMVAPVEAAPKRPAFIPRAQPLAAPALLTLERAVIESETLPEVDTPPSDAPLPAPPTPEVEPVPPAEPARRVAVELPRRPVPAPTASEPVSTPPPAETPTRTRLASAPPTPSPDTEPLMVEAVPTPAPASVTETLAPDETPADAPPPAAEVLPVELANAALPRSARLEPDLPMVPEMAAERATETEREVAAVTSTVTRYDRPISASTDAPATAVVAFAPSDITPVSTERSLAATDLAAPEAEAPPVPSPRPKPATPTVDTPAPAVDLPGLAVAQDTYPVEAQATVEIQMPAATRLAVAEAAPAPDAIVSPTVETAPSPAAPTEAAPALYLPTPRDTPTTPDDRPVPIPIPAIEEAPASEPMNVPLTAPAVEPQATASEAALAVATPTPAPTSRTVLVSRPSALLPSELDLQPLAPRADPELARDNRPLELPDPLVLVDVAPGAAVVLPEPDERRYPPTKPLDVDLNPSLQTLLPPNPHRQRAPEVRLEMAKEMGGSEETERAVASGLDWLARHQNADGRWDSDDFDDRCGACPGRTRIDVDIALTGLSLLCFLATDNTHVKDGEYRDVVARGLRWLRNQQGPSGDILGDESMYSHGIATIALAEAYGMTGDPTLRAPLEDAVAFIVDARNRRRGGWRYAPQQAGDTSVMGWQVMAMSSARHAGIEVDEGGFDSARRWLGQAAAPRRTGLYVYQPGRLPSPAMTAEAMFAKQLLGHRPDEEDMVASAAYVLEHPPDWSDDANTYFWYYATLALFQHQGEAWRRWNERVKEQLLANQVTGGRAAGSWAPDDQWSNTGGRVYQTAICVLTLEVYYRYLPRYVQDASR